MKSATIVTYLNYTIIFSCFLFSKYIPPPAGLPPISMEVLGIFVGTLWGWITFGMGWPSILGLLAFGMSDYCAMNAALSTAFGTQLIIMILALLLLASFVEQANLTDFVLDLLMSRKSCKGRPFVIFYYFVMAGYIVAILSFGNAVFIIFLGFFKAMMNKTGIKPHTKTVTCFMIGLMLAMLMSELSLPFKSTGLYSIGAYEAVTGQQVNLMKYVIFMLPICVSILTLYVLLCKYIFKPDLSMLTNFSHEIRETSRLNKRQKYSLAGILIGMFCLLVPSIIPVSWPIKETFNELGGGGLALLVIGILMAVQVDGKPLMDIRKIGQFFPWAIFFCLVFLFPVAGAISSDTLGIKQMILADGEAFFRSISTIMAVVCLIALPAFFTNFMNNAVIGITALTIYGSIAGSIELNSNIVFGMIVFAANLGMFFPAANPIATMAFAEREIVGFRQLLVYSFITWAIMCIWSGIICYIYGNIVY